jgi:hypothetical protein
MSALKHYLITIDLMVPARLHGYLMTDDGQDLVRAAGAMTEYADARALPMLPYVLATELSDGFDLVRDIMCADEPSMRERLQSADRFHWTMFVMHKDHPRNNELMGLH